MRLVVLGKDMIGTDSDSEYVVCVESRGKKRIVTLNKSRWKRACVGHKVEITKAELARSTVVEKESAEEALSV